jgi:hypothetical protein
LVLSTEVVVVALEVVVVGRVVTVVSGPLAEDAGLLLEEQERRLTARTAPMRQGPTIVIIRAPSV